MNETTEENQTPDEIIQAIQSRLSNNENPYGDKISLNDTAVEKVKAFIKWMAQKHEAPIKLRTRSSLLFGIGKDDQGKDKNNFNAEHLYAEIFHDIKKEIDNDVGDFNVSCSLKFDITFDKGLTGKYLKYDDNNSLIKCDAGDANMQYGQILLGDTPVLYMLYIAPSELNINAID